MQIITQKQLDGLNRIRESIYDTIHKKRNGHVRDFIIFNDENGYKIDVTVLNWVYDEDFGDWVDYTIEYYYASQDYGFSDEFLHEFGEIVKYTIAGESIFHKKFMITHVDIEYGDNDTRKYVLSLKTYKESTQAEFERWDGKDVVRIHEIEPYMMKEWYFYNKYCYLKQILKQADEKKERRLERIKEEKDKIETQIKAKNKVKDIPEAVIALMKEIRFSKSIVSSWEEDKARYTEYKKLQQKMEKMMKDNLSIKEYREFASNLRLELIWSY